MTHIFLAAGDLAPDRDNYDESYDATRDVLKAADIAFAQLETSFAEKGVRLPQARHAVLARPDGADALARAGFDVISMAGNHVLDWGNDAFFETRANMERVGLKVVGAGANIAEARRPRVDRVASDGAMPSSSPLASTLSAMARQPSFQGTPHSSAARMRVASPYSTP